MKKVYLFGLSVCLASLYSGRLQIHYVLWLEVAKKIFSMKFYAFCCRCCFCCCCLFVCLFVTVYIQHTDLPQKSDSHLFFLRMNAGISFWNYTNQRRQSLNKISESFVQIIMNALWSAKCACWNFTLMYKFMYFNVQMYLKAFNSFKDFIFIVPCAYE